MKRQRGTNWRRYGIAACAALVGAALVGCGAILGISDVPEPAGSDGGDGGAVGVIESGVGFGVDACGADQSMCMGTCVNEQMDPDNCGLCGHRCTVGCSAGRCMVAGTIAAGSMHTCAVRLDGGVACWGDNSKGQLGNGTTAGALTASAVLGISAAMGLAAGALHTCAIVADGGVVCWGDNSKGQLGNGTTTRALTPVTVTGLTGATRIAAGDLHTCAALSDGGVACWGENVFGQLGNGTMADSPTWVSVSGVADVSAIAAGSLHTCAVVTEGQLACWGNNIGGQLGDGTSSGPGLCSGTPCATVPVMASDIIGATAVAAGAAYTCILSEPLVECWGENGSLQLGSDVGGSTLFPLPVLSSVTTDPVAIAAGNLNACARRSTGEVACWGDNMAGQVGAPDAGNPSPPVLVLNLLGAADVAVSESGSHACAMLIDGGAACWGANGSGQLGNGSTANTTEPVTVIGF